MITDGLTVYKTQAKFEVYQIIQTGQTIVLRKPATTDELGETLTWSELTFKAHPVKYNPFSRKIASKVSWAESVNVMATISFLDMENQSLRVEDLKSYNEIVIDGKEFVLKEVEAASSFADSWLYVHLGAVNAS